MRNREFSLCYSKCVDLLIKVQLTSNSVLFQKSSLSLLPSPTDDHQPHRADGKRAYTTAGAKRIADFPHAATWEEKGRKEHQQEYKNGTTGLVADHRFTSKITLFYNTYFYGFSNQANCIIK
jgi:hypothetical protein